MSRVCSARAEEAGAGRWRCSQGWTRLRRGDTRMDGSECTGAGWAATLAGTNRMRGDMICMGARWGTDARSVFRPPRVGEYAG
jgi:hypothetical protein